MEQQFTLDWAGKTLTVKTGLLAQQANGSCTIQYGDTVVLCTATMGSPREGLDFFPLQVDFEERMYAAGRIKGSRFIKREGRPTDEAVLSGRLVDRAIRPLFTDNLRNEIAVVATVFSHDQENDADIPALIGSSLALLISDIPWAGPLAACRVGRIDGKWILNPTYAQTAQGDLDLVVAGVGGRTIMLEAGANEILEADIHEAVGWAHTQLEPVIRFLQEIQQKIGKTKVNPLSPKTEEDRIAQEERQRIETLAREYLQTRAGELLYAELLKSKADRKRAVSRLKADLEAHLSTEGFSKEHRGWALSVLEEFVDHEITRAILDDGKRADGRALDEVRQIESTVAIMPRTHGSGLFMRGATQVLSSVTLGGPGMQQTLDTMEYQVKKRYFHHYNFPSYSVGETKGNRGPGRREIGHGALAERALMPVLPDQETFPYTIRVVSEVLGSNGSSSMGATCGSSLALMDAGVPIKAPVAGVAVGLASDQTQGRFRVFTDLQDLEDGEGGMDFKVAGTTTGITAIQMDTKTHGIPLQTVLEALEHAKRGRLRILEAMQKAIAAPRAELSKWAPRIESFRINPERIRDVIGPGGKMINEIILACQVEVDVEDDGLVMITSVNAEGLKRAVEWIKQLTREIVVGEVFTGKVTRIMDFGAFVEIAPKQEGLVHISELAPSRVAKVTDVVNIGDTVNVKVYEIDSMGRLNLSIKRTLPDYVDKPRESRPPRENR